MNDVFLSLGSNLGERMRNLHQATEQIRELCGTISKLSDVYETEPWGTFSRKPYLNQVVMLHTLLNAQALLNEILPIERALGRVRDEHRNSDRTIDIDILFFNDEMISAPDLQIPHPRLHLRNFILIPLLQIAGAHIHPVFEKEVRELLKACKDTGSVHKYIQPAGPCFL